jgi:hypothetical protein
MAYSLPQIQRLFLAEINTSSIEYFITTGSTIVLPNSITFRELSFEQANYSEKRSADAKGTYYSKTFELTISNLASQVNLEGKNLVVLFLDTNGFLWITGHESAFTISKKDGQTGGSESKYDLAISQKSYSPIQSIDLADNPELGVVAADCNTGLDGEYYHFNPSTEGSGSGDITGAVSLGGSSIYDSEFDGVLRFKGLTAGSNISLSSTSTSIGIAATGLLAVSAFNTYSGATNNRISYLESITGSSGGGGGNISGSTGSVDNAVLRANGTGGATVQTSAVIIEDNANLTLGTTSLTGSSRILSASSSDAFAHLVLLPFGSSGQVITATPSGTGGGITLGRTTDAGTSRTISVQGTQTNISFNLLGKGTGGITLNPSSGTIRLFVDGGSGFGGLLLSDDGSTTTVGMNTQNSSSGVPGRHLNIKAGDPDSASNLNGGNLFLSGGDGEGTGHTGNIGLLASSLASFGGGEKILFVANCTILPSTNPVGGGFIMVSGGSLVYRGSSGTVTVIAPA